MTRKEFPLFPAFPSVRLATGADVKRMAELSVLGFRDSEIFRYERPHYKEFPQDAVASFANLYRSRLLHPRVVVIVAEDWMRSDEMSCSSNNDDNGSYPIDMLEPAIVGVASWFFPKGSPRTGQFVVSHISDPEPALDRDLCQKRLDLFTSVTEAEEKKYFAGKSICDKLVVHPSYRRRGHANTMLEWGLHLSDMDGVDQGVIPSHMGEAVYLGLGYKVIGEIHVPSDGEVDGFSQRVLVYVAKPQHSG